jgi:hypothetical protein
MSREPTKPVAPTGIENWYAAPLAVDGALAEPLRRLATTRVAIRGAVRGLLVRRLLAPFELNALRAAGVGPLELSQAFTALTAALPAAAGQAGPLGLMVRAMGRVVRNVRDVAILGDETEMHKLIGAAVAHAIAEDLFPPSKTAPLTSVEGDVSATLRKAVHELLTARTITPDTLDRIAALDRRLLAARLEDRLPLMRAVVPPARGAALERIVRVAATQLRLQPPVDAWALDAALAAGTT